MNVAIVNGCILGKLRGHWQQESRSIGTKQRRLVELNVHFTRGQRESTSDVKNKSAVTDHVIKENHVINWESAKIVKKESDWFARGVKEAITICQHKKNMNRDEGRFFLSPIYKPLIKDSQS